MQRELDKEMDERTSLAVPCCPQLAEDKPCDVIDFHYRLLYPKTVTVAQKPYPVNVELMVHAQLERCSGPLTQGDLVYSTTLFPGERVRLFSMDRRTRFSYDAESQLQYRRVQTSEERYYMSSMSNFMSDLTVRDVARSTSTHRGSWERNADTSGPLETLFAGASVDVQGSHNSESIGSFLRELRQHAEASHHRSIAATRTTSSVSIGEVQSRTHAEGETEDHFEAASRVFSNPNKCRAVTYFFYQINKTQHVKFHIVAIRKRVVDTAVDTHVTNRPFIPKGDITVIPAAVLATNPKRIDIERTARLSAIAQREDERTSDQPQLRIAALTMAPAQLVEPIPVAIRKQAIRVVNNDLMREKILTRDGDLVDEIKTELSFARTVSLPTPGLLVRGCLDDCVVCEPTVIRGIILDLQRKQLENALLKRQIELLDKAQEYRCCPTPSDTSDNGNPGGE